MKEHTVEGTGVREKEVCVYGCEKWGERTIHYRFA